MSILAKKGITKNSEVTAADVIKPLNQGHIAMVAVDTRSGDNFVSVWEETNLT